MEVSVIIPTLCNSSRATSLLRALKSVLDRNKASVRPLVVVNGTVFDQSLYSDLCRRRDLRVLYLESGGLPAALRFGRDQVDTEFFCFLDDDDLYLPGAIDTRLRPLTDLGVDLVVTNGFRVSGARREKFAPDMKAFGIDPLRSLFDTNWLPSCGGLYRTATIPAEFFDVSVHYREWTYLAFQIALKKKIFFIDDCTFEIHDTLNSLSKRAEYFTATAEVFSRMLTHDLSRRIRRVVKNRRSDAFHDLTFINLAAGNIGGAWKYHLKSLCSPTGLLKYGFSTRHLMRASLLKHALPPSQ